MKEEKLFEVWKMAYKESQKHEKPSKETLEILKKLSEINEKHFTRDFDENKKISKQIKITNILLGFIVFLLLAILGNL